MKVPTSPMDTAWDPPRERHRPDLAMLNRKTLLDLRDSLRSLLTVLESE